MDANFALAWSKMEEESRSISVESLSRTEHTEVRIMSRQDNDGDMSSRSLARLTVVTSNFHPLHQRFQSHLLSPSKHHGLTKLLSPATNIEVSTQDGVVTFCAEMYEEILYDSNKCTRLDLLEYYNNHGANVQFWKFVRQVVETVATLHQLGFVHMDISLENVMLTPTQAYLIDYESVLDFRGHSYVARQSLSHHPIKPLYAPIEHSECNPNDMVDLVAYDIFAVGVLIYIGTYGEYPRSKALSSEEIRKGKFQVDVLKDIFVRPNHVDGDGSRRIFFNERATAEKILQNKMWDLLIPPSAVATTTMDIGCESDFKE